VIGTRSQQVSRTDFFISAHTMNGLSDDHRQLSFAECFSTQSNTGLDHNDLLVRFKMK